MHDNGKNSGLSGARALGALGSILIILKKAVSMRRSTWRTPAIHTETDYLGDMRENVDLMRRRLTV